MFIDYIEKNQDTNVDKSINTKIQNSFQKEHFSLKTDIKINILENKEIFLEYQNTILEMFPNINNLQQEELIDEIKKYQAILGNRININYIKYILYNYKMQEKTNNTNHNYEFSIEKIKESIRNNLFNEVLELNQETKNARKHIEQQFAFIVYILSKEEELKKIEKQKLIKWFKELINLYNEQKIIEIYEIHLDDNGNIIIKGRINGQNINIKFNIQTKEFSILGNNLQKLSKQEIDKILFNHNTFYIFSQNHKNKDH